MSELPPIIFDEWGTYVTNDGERVIFVSYDEGATRDDRPTDLPLCVRVQIKINLSEENEFTPEENGYLYEIEEELCEILQQAKVHCRLIGRLTYDDTREIVFQVADGNAFRQAVRTWQEAHSDREIMGATHAGWDFFDDMLMPSDADRIFMADQSVVENLIDGGSDPDKDHVLEYVFMGEAEALEGIATVLLARGYHFHAEPDYASEQVTICKTMPLDLQLIVEESLSNHQLAEECGATCDGWDCAIVR